MSELGLNYPVTFDKEAALANLKSFQADVATSTARIRKDIGAMNDALGGTRQAANDTAKNADALDKVGGSAKNAASETGRMADRQRDAKRATDDLNRALDAEAEKTSRISRMIDESLRKQAARVAPANPSASSSTGFKVGMSVPRDPGLFARQNAQMGLGATGKISEEALNGVKKIEEAAQGVKKTEQAVEKVTEAVHVNVGAFREGIVLVREFARGDFTRMAGSASILAQRMGALEKLAPLISGGVIGVTAAVTVGAAALIGYAVAYAKGTEEAGRFGNALRLSGNYAGLTATNYEEMASKIGRVTRTSIASNEELISGLAATNKFTRGEIDDLVTSADRFSKATGQDASEVVANFAKMADGPTKFAETYQQQYAGVITPAQVEHIRMLEETGRREEALAELVKDVTNGIAKNAVDNTNTIAGAWNNAINAVSNYWGWLKRVASGTTTKQDSLASVNSRIRSIQMSGMNRGQDSQLPALYAQRDALTAQIDAENKLAAAQAKKEQTIAQGTAAGQRYRDTYEGMTDRTRGFTRAVADLDATLAARKAAVAAGSKDDSLAADLRNRNKTVAALKKQYEPEAVGAANKSARAAESAAKKAAAQEAREAAAATKKYEGEITRLKGSIADLGLTEREKAEADALDRAGLGRDIKQTGEKAKAVKDLADQLSDAQAVKKVADALKDLQLENAKLSATEEDRAKIEARVRAGLPSDLAITNAQTQAIDAQAVANARLAKSIEDKKAAKDGTKKVEDDLRGAANDNQDRRADLLGGSPLQRNLLAIQRVADARKRDIAALKLEQNEQSRLNKLVDQQAKDDTATAKLEDQIDKTQRLGDFLTQLWENPREAMKAFFQDFLRNLLTSIAKATILKSLLPGGGAAAGGIGGILKSALSSVFGGGRAVGGDVDSRKYYLVGENGPELFAPGRSGTIIPNKNMSGGGSSTVSIGATNIHIHGNANDNDRQQLAAQLDAQKRMIRQEIEAAMRKRR